MKSPWTIISPILLLPVLFCLISPWLGQLVAAKPKFERQTIDDQIQIGYGLAIGRVDADDWDDILLADAKEVVWYQNPGASGKPWPKHVMARNLTAKDNVCLAARDIDGDGLVEVAVGANWNPNETSNAEVSGTLFYLKRPADATKPWTPVQITPHDPTTHRMHWIKSDEGMQLVVLPLHGVDNKKGNGKTVSVSIFEIANGTPKLVRKVDTGTHMTHNFALTSDLAFGDQEFMLVAGKEGYLVAVAGGQTMQVVDSSQSKGAGEARRYPSSSRAFVGIEPMHGTDVALYREVGEGEWEKEVLDTGLSAGHALAAGQLFGSAKAEIVAGWRGKDADKKFGIKIYEPSESGWTTHWLDENEMACEDLKLADLNGDGKLDVIGAGRGTKNVVIYWNESTE